MKHIKFYLIVIALIFCGNLYPQSFESVYSLYSKKDYFHFRDAVSRVGEFQEAWQKPFLKALSECIFADFSSSAGKISSLLNDYPQAIPDSLMKELYENKYYDHIFRFEYADAGDACKILITKYKKYLSQDEAENFPDEAAMLKSLKDIPKQEILKSSEVKIKIQKDMAGLLRTPVTINDTNVSFVFDTGADFSVIVESLAKRLGVKMTGDEFKVGTATDKKVFSRAGVLDEFKIGGITMKNVVFYVMKDEDFTFGPYKIEGIIGAPVIRAFGEISFTKNNEVIIPDIPAAGTLKNFAYDGYSPVIQVIYNKDSLNFLFDTGNNSVLLFAPFFEKYKSFVTDNYKLQKLETGGAGGVIETDGYVLDKVLLSSGNSSAELKNISLMIKPLSEIQKYFHGNLGQGYFSRFDTLTMNFKNMYIEFK